MTLEIRPARPEEYGRAGEVVVAADAALPGAHATGEYMAELADVARRSKGADILVALDGAELVGCVTYVPDHTSPWAEMVEPGESAIRMLGVDPAYQARGTGRALVEECIRRARAAGRKAVFLHSTPWMTAAHHLYEALGFVRTPERDWLPVPDVPLVAFRLDLA